MEEKRRVTVELDSSDLEALDYLRRERALKSFSNAIRYALNLAALELGWERNGGRGDDVG